MDPKTEEPGVGAEYVSEEHHGVGKTRDLEEQGFHQEQQTAAMYRESLEPRSPLHCCVKNLRR